MADWLRLSNVTSLSGVTWILVHLHWDGIIFPHIEFVEYDDKPDEIFFRCFPNLIGLL